MNRTIRLLTVAGLAVTAAAGAVTHQASAAEIPATPAAVPVPAAAPGSGVVPGPALVPGGRPVAVPAIPDAIKPPAGSRPIGAYLVTEGTQTYTCDAATGTYPAASVPEARLLGIGGWVHHFAGPSWQSERDGSLVTAAKVASSPRTGTIPELLLKVTSRTGTGVLSRADYISRLHTSGGVAPAGTCTPGQTATVAYKAVYVFWSAPATR